MKKSSAARHAAPAETAPEQRADAPGTPVLPLTRKEVWIAVLVAYLKITLPLNAFIWVYRHVEDELLQILLLFVIGSAALSIFNTMGTDFVIRLRGQLKPRQFIWMYLASVGMLALAVISPIGFMKATIGSVVRILLLPISIQYDREDCLMIGLGLLMAAVLWLIETIKAHRQRCDACGGYAHREEIDVPGTYQSEELGERTTTTREVEHVRVDQYGITEDIRETTTTTKAVAYTKVKCIRCRYCGKVFKIYRDSGTFDRDKKDTRYYTEWH